MQLIAQLIDQRRGRSPSNEWYGDVRFVLPHPAIALLQDGRVKTELWTGKQLFSYSLSPLLQSEATKDHAPRVYRPVLVNMRCGGREYKAEK